MNKRAYLYCGTCRWYPCMWYSRPTDTYMPSRVGRTILPSSAENELTSETEPVLCLVLTDTAFYRKSKYRTLEEGLLLFGLNEQSDRKKILPDKVMLCSRLPHRRLTCDVLIVLIDGHRNELRRSPTVARENLLIEEHKPETKCSCGETGRHDSH